MNNNEAYRPTREQLDPNDAGRAAMPRARNTLALLMGVLSVCAGTLVLVGWACDIPVLKSIQPGWVSMKANSALGFILAGVALLASSLSSSALSARLARICALLIGLIALLTLGEYLLSWNPGIDQWLVREPAHMVGTLHPGRMAPDTAFCFLLLATGLILASGARKTTMRLWLTSILGSLTMAVALAALLSYCSETIGAFGIWGLTLMSFPSATLFILLSIAIVLGGWPEDISLWSLNGKTVMGFALWSIMISVSLTWGLHQQGHHLLESATVAARVNINKDLSFRRWATSHGGVYVTPTEHTPPNPYLNVVTRDVVTTTGRPLTLMNPAYMLREMQQDFGDEYGTRSHLTSLKLLNPANAADPWQVKALSSFERGGKELLEMQYVDDQPYLKLMLPVFVEAGCLKCHAQQGYQVGDVRGGIDSSIPLAPFLARTLESSIELTVSHGAIWLLGISGLLLFYRREHSLAAENQRSEDALRASEERFRLAADTANDLVYEWDLQEEVQWFGRIDEMLGYGKGEFPRTLQGWKESVHPDDRDLVMAAIQAHLEGGDPYALKYRIRRNDDVYLWWSARGAVVKAPDGTPVRWIGTVTDISEQLKLEESLRQSQKMEAIGTLAGGIAHDFNNILSAVVGYTELALMEVTENTDVHNYLCEVGTAAARATELVRQILTFSRKQKQDKQPLQVALIVKEALKLLRASIPTTVEIRQEIVSQAMVLADPTQIHQLIMNLCTNGYQAMVEHGGVLGVTLQDIDFEQETMDGAIELSPGRYLLLAVSDSGCGMDKDVLARIFDPYFTTKGVGKGTGLGLAVVHGIVKDLQGRVSVYSEPGRGTTFHVYLPVIAGEAVPEVVAEAVPLAMGHERVMVVDDESAIRDLATKFLTQSGYQVDAFVNGLEAWQAISEAPDHWDLLITDQTMPEMTGTQLAAKMLEIRPDLPIILCSGYSGIMESDEARKAGVDVYLQKPLNRNVFLTEVARVLAGKKVQAD